MKTLETLWLFNMEARSWCIGFRPTAKWLLWLLMDEISTKPFTDTTATPSLVNPMSLDGTDGNSFPPAEEMVIN